MKLIALLMSLLVIGSFFIVIYLNRDISTAYEFSDERQNVGKKGIVTNIWIANNKLDRLKNNEIKYLFVDIGHVKNGNIMTPKAEIKYFLAMIDKYEYENNYSFEILAYSEINTYNEDISGVNFKNNFIESHKYLTDIGFDGVLVDIEPVPLDKRRVYIDILKDLDASLTGKTISVYTGNFDENPSEWEWDSNLYEEVSKYADIISVPGYDTGIKNDVEYINYVRSQMDEISRLNMRSEIFLAVPTHKDYPERLDLALNQFNSYKDRFSGIVIFAEWTTDENEWDYIESYF